LCKSSELTADNAVPAKKGRLTRFAVDEMDSPAHYAGHQRAPSSTDAAKHIATCGESDMSQDQIADTKNKLDDLEQRIHAAKSSLGARGDLNDQAQKDWMAMVEKHGDIRRKLDASDDHPAGVIEGLDFDVDILRTSLETWVAKVEGNFDK
jgi:hypothetical protein